MEITILGTGCSKCKALYETVKEVVAELKLDAQVVKQEDMMEIMKYNVMLLPAMVVNGKVAAKGAVKYAEVRQILEGSVKNVVESGDNCSCGCK